jgi:hypothetical protein
MSLANDSAQQRGEIMNKRSLSIMLLSVTALGACAKHSKDIPAQYVSPMQYNSYSCKQIEQEMRVLSTKVSDLAAQCDKTASNDDVQMGVGLILLWPTLFFLDGDTPQAAEYARLKGEFDALEKAAIQKNCSLDVERPKASKPQEVTKEKPAYPQH